MNRAAWLIAAVCAVAVLSLVACGGGGGGGDSPPVQSPRRSGIDFGYYWTVPGQIAATSAHVTFVHIPDGGDWDSAAGREAIIQRQIEQMQEARARGIERVYLSTGFLTFTSKYEYRGANDLAAYRMQLDALDLTRMVVAVMPLDEPDMLGVADGPMTIALNDARHLFPSARVLVSYGDHGSTPGIAAADWVGHDAYELGAGVLQRLPTIRPDQSYVLFPGGGNPWRADPGPFVDFAFAHANVVAVWAFIYAERAGEPGIGTNGMLASYCSAGREISGKPGPC